MSNVKLRTPSNGSVTLSPEDTASDVVLSVPAVAGDLFGQGNILGTVSQSGGVPTGAIIERGSNANGEYVRFADGTQICTHRQMSSSSSNATWTYPAEFAPGKTDCLMGTATPMTGTNVVSVVQSTTGSAIFTIRDTLNYGVRIEADVWLFAMGRWF